MAPSGSVTQNVTVRLNRRTLRKAKILAAKRNTSISGLLAEQIEGGRATGCRDLHPLVPRT